MVCISLEPNSPLVSTGLTAFQNQPKTFPSSASAASHFCSEAEFVVGDYLSDSTVRHYSIQKHLLIEIFKNPFLTSISCWHITNTLIDFSFPWEADCRRERWKWGGGWFYLDLAPQGQVQLIIHNHKQNVYILQRQKWWFSLKRLNFPCFVLLDAILSI